MSALDQNLCGVIASYIVQLCRFTSEGFYF